MASLVAVFGFLMVCHEPGQSKNPFLKILKIHSFYYILLYFQAIITNTCGVCFCFFQSSLYPLLSQGLFGFLVFGQR